MTATLTLTRTRNTNRQSPATSSPMGSAAVTKQIPVGDANQGQQLLSSDDFGAFVHQYGERLLNVARQFLRNEDDAADAVQDALLSAYTSLHTFQGKSTVYTWLYRIVANTCLMKIRSQSRQREVFSREILPMFAEGDNQGPSAREFGGDSLEREELRSAVRTCIDRLPHDYRMVVVLRDIEELDTDQTATVLRISNGAVKTRLHRARQALRLLLEPTMGDGSSTI